MLSDLGLKIVKNMGENIPIAGNQLYNVVFPERGNLVPFHFKIFNVLLHPLMVLAETLNGSHNSISVLVEKNS